MRFLELTLVAAGLTACTLAGQTALTDLRQGVEEAEQETRHLRTANGRLADRLASLEELGTLRGRIAELEAVLASRDPEVDGRIELAEASVAKLRDELRAREAQLEAVVEQQQAAVDALVSTRVDAVDRVLADRLSAELASLEDAVDSRLSEIKGDVAQALGAAERGRLELDALRETLPGSKDVAELWRTLVAPVVQIHGPYSVGSGVLLESRTTDEGAVTHLLTAWHVVRDVQDDPSNPITPVPVRIYLEGDELREETATVLARDAERDICLLELDTRAPVDNGARLASPERVARMATFEPVYAVGCPLGTDPLPTFGAVATPSHMVDGVRYMMINAPTYIGNSGGGIFDGESHELIGVFAKIYNHGTLRPTIVPHMGLVVPMDEIYAWLDDLGYGIVDEAGKRHLARVESVGSPRASSVATATDSDTNDTSSGELGQWGATRR